MLWAAKCPFMHQESRGIGADNRDSSAHASASAFVSKQEEEEEENTCSTVTLASEHQVELNTGWHCCLNHTYF